MGAHTAARNTKSTKHGRNQTVRQFRPPSTLIQSASLMQPTSNSTSKKRCSSELDDDLTALQPRRKSARLQQVIPTHSHGTSPQLPYSTARGSTRRTSTRARPQLLHVSKTPKVEPGKRALPKRGCQVQKSGEPAKPINQGQRREIEQKRLCRGLQIRNNTTLESCTVENKDPDPSRLKRQHQDTRERSTFSNNPLPPTSVNNTHRCKNERKKTAEQPVAKRSRSKTSYAPENIIGSHTAKRQCIHGEEQEFKSALSANRVRQDPQPVTKSIIVFNDNSLITDWVLNQNWTHQSSLIDQIPELPAAISYKPQLNLPSPKSNFACTEAPSKKSERSTASVHDSDYHDALHKRNIFIERDDPPLELIRRAHRVISRPRASPEMGDSDVQKITEKSRRHRNDAEDIIVKQIASFLIPAMNEVPDRRLELNTNQPWSNSVPVPLDQDMLTITLPLPKPKPGLAFGYSEDAFSHKQLRTIDLLVDDQFGRSYAVPDRKLRFPFLSVEFKSQAKGGTHYVATNQAAGAGAIALNGNLDLVQRSFSQNAYDYDEPQFFSVTMDHQLACVNVHWLKAPSETGQHSFHVEGLSKHLLDDPTSIRKIVQAIKNILDYSCDTRLHNLCEALDAYRETVVRDREAANAERRRLNEPSSIIQDGRFGRTQTDRIGPMPPPHIQQDNSNQPFKGLSHVCPMLSQVGLQQRS